MPKLTVEGFGTFEVDKNKRLVLAVEQAHPALVHQPQVAQLEGRFEAGADREEAGHGVLDVVHVADGFEPADQDLVGEQRLGHEGGDHRPQRLPRPVGIERPGDNHRQIE